MAERYFDEEAALALMPHLVPEDDFVDAQQEVIDHGEKVGMNFGDSALNSRKFRRVSAGMTHELSALSPKSGES